MSVTLGSRNSSTNRDTDALSALFNDGQIQCEQFTVDIGSHSHSTSQPPPYLASRADTDTWGPAAWSAAAHYLDRMLRNHLGRRTAELVALAQHPAQCWSPEVAWLTKHLLLNAPAPLPLRRSRYDRMLVLFPGLAGLSGVTRAEVNLPIQLRYHITGAHPYLASQGIYD